VLKRKSSHCNWLGIGLRELGPHGINVNCVAPGFFLTPFLAHGDERLQVIEVPALH